LRRSGSIRRPLDYSRGPEQVWVDGAWRVRDGQELNLTAPMPTTAGSLKRLEVVDPANQAGDFYLIRDHLSSHPSGPVRQWVTARPRIHPMPIPTGACWLNLQEG
jgi:hypothetical protein